MRRLFLLLFGLIFSINGFAQKEREKISWDKDRPLVWSDFKGNPAPLSPFKANTNAGISFSWSYSENGSDKELKYTAESYFYPQLSWKKVVKEKEFLLAHEQLHFDIAELHARMLRKALSEYKIGINVKKELVALYNLYGRKLEEMQQQFDKETNHSKIKEAELEWRDFVKEELDKYQAYAN
ncbi:DUF922 domain-containing protein [Zunongwangia sp. H14]|uniref:DUF922 domain-containing protein n=1 Tax=Zunongwangia sp. H14 TaxID=3240792 RepID=UPI00356A0882